MEGGTSPDMATMSDITMERINSNLKQRYSRDQIYTYSGTILIAVNPYKELGIYRTPTIQSYIGRKLNENKPHIYAISEYAYSTLKKTKENQSVVISGESGAGKTETTKFILKYLCEITNDISTWVENQILEANTILEAFGNAKTIRNDNSSRFGKFIQICFDGKFKIRGCIIQDYLLEQSRIVFQSSEERNYHVFYQFVQGGLESKELTNQYYLKKPEYYRYLNQSGCIHLPGMDDKSKFEALRLAFNVLQIPQEYTDGIFSTLSAILLLGNLEFEDIDGEKCKQTEDDIAIIEIISKLLGVGVSELDSITLLRQINVRGNITEIPLKVNEARENRNSMSKSLYSYIFTWLIHHINKCINPGFNSNFIGLLDIFGFENFKTNSFEQLCINFANEKLHSFFNQAVFKVEQEVYRSEGIVFSHIKYSDNINCLELIEKPPRCLLKLLTEQCHMPKGSDASYLQNIHSEFTTTNSNYLKGDDPLQWQTQFGILHYAGSVFYNIKGFVEKNRSVTQDLFFNLLEDSDNLFIRELSKNMDTSKNKNTAKGKLTVGDGFKLQLEKLVDVLESTQPWYVRCIKPNAHKQPGNYDESIITEQLKYLGMLEIIRIRKEGYPIHLGIDEFVIKYKIIDKYNVRKERRDTVKAILGKKNMADQWQIGHTKVFLRSKIYELLEDERQIVLNAKAVIVQTCWRGFYVRKSFHRRLRATLTIQRYYRDYKTRLAFLRKRRAVITLQSNLRGFFAREFLQALREMKRVENEIKLREKRKSIGDLSQVVKGDELDNLVEFLNGDTVQVQLVPVTTMEEENNIISKSDSGSSTTPESSDSSRSHSPPALPPPDEALIFTQEVKPKPVAIAVTRECLLKPTLPEPTIPPPPPPSKDVVIQKIAIAQNGTEPIYESIKPREPEPEPTPKSPARPISSSSNVSNGVQSAHSWKFQDERVVEKPKPPPPEDKTPKPKFQEERENRAKIRIDKKLQELNEAKEVIEEDNWDLSEYAKLYFNLDKSDSVEMTSYTKNYNLSNSHLFFYDPENVNIACCIFKDLWKYMRSELKPDMDTLVIQTIVGYGIERDELKDEIYVQILRQCNGNPHFESLEKLWHLLCLVVVSFPPRKLLQKYVVHFIKKSLTETSSAKLMDQMQWCLENVVKVYSRKLPPSTVEILATQRLTFLLIRFFFLDNKTKAIDIHPGDTAGDAIEKLSKAIGLANTSGWALYETSTGDHVPAHYYLYDVISNWEIPSNKKSGGESRLLFKKRIFLSRSIPEDPIEIHLLYSQGVQSIVKKDEYPVAEKVSLQLAGLQLQVDYGDFDNGSFDVEAYLPRRILKGRQGQQWKQILQQSHRQYGTGKSEIVSKIWYLSCLMQYPLYGTTTFPVIYRGYWLYGNTLLLGVNQDGLYMIKEDDKFIMYEYNWKQLEKISVEVRENIITIKILASIPPAEIKSFVFESKQVIEIYRLIGSYCPALASEVNKSDRRVVKTVTNADRQRLHANIVNTRKALIDSGILKKPNLTANIMNTLRNRNKKKKFEVDKNYTYNYWSFAKYGQSQSLIKLSEEEEPVGLAVNSLLMNYSGLGGACPQTEEDVSTVLQTILEKCWNNTDLTTELYLQLIKQTTDSPEPNSKINARYWAALSLVSSVSQPPEIIKKYLISHLKKCSADYVTEEGASARFAEKCLFTTLNKGGRQWLPSKQEIICIVNRRLITTRVYLMDGKFINVHFNSIESANQVLESIVSQIGLQEGRGYALYESGTNGWERSLVSDEKLVEVMSRWERQKTTSTTQLNFKFILKKHLFVDGFINLNDAVERELLHHQLLHSARVDKFPISETEAAMLVALQAQVELGDYTSTAAGEFPDYCHVSSHCLPTRIAALVSHEAVARHHQSLISTSAKDAKQGVMNLLYSWPLHYSTVFDVGQSFTSNWPRILWLAIDQNGIHLLKQRTKSVLCSFNYEYIISYSPSQTHLLLITRNEDKSSKIILTTGQGYQISQLIKDYIQIVFEVE